jgi:hypothetical protein
VTTYTTLHLGEAAVEVAVVVAVMALAVALHAYIQRRFKSEILRKHNDVAGFVFTAAGVIYAVVLGFVVVVVWEKYGATEALVQDHINAVSDLYRVVGGLPDPVRSQVRTELRHDVNEIISVEWPQMSSRGGVTPIPPFLETMAHQISLSFAFLLGTENRWTQLFMTALLAGLIATLLIVIAEFDSPFSGSVRISNDGWISLQHYLPQIP